jgi:hypothetical protein
MQENFITAPRGDSRSGRHPPPDDLHEVLAIRGLCHRIVYV